MQDVSNVLVTGGAGFIGAHLCDRLVREGAHVTAVDNFLLGRPSKVAHLVESGRFRLIQADAADASALDDVFAAGRFQAVFHLAANSDIAKSHEDPGIDLTNTFMTTATVLEAMRRHRCRDLVFASTSAVYGEAPGQIAEDHGPLQPLSHYGAAKLASEAFISSYCENYGLRAAVARFPNVIGEGATHGVIFDFIEKLRRTPRRLEVLGDGSQEKPYLYVADLVDALILLRRVGKEGLNVANIGPESTTSVAFIAQTVARTFGGDPDIVYGSGARGWVGDIPRFEYDTTKIRSLGWAPAFTSDEAVELTAKLLVEGAPR